MEIKITKIDNTPRSPYIKNTGSGSITSSSSSSAVESAALEYINNLFTYDAENQAIKANYNLYSVGDVSAYGLGASGGTGGGISYDRLDLWNDYDTSKSGYVLSAGLGNDLNSRLVAVEVNGSTSISTSGTGNTVTSVSKSGSTLVFNKNLTFSESSHSHNFLLNLVTGTQTGSTSNWTGVLNDVSELYDGLTINYWLPWAGVSSATLNLTLQGGTTTGAINLYYGGTTRLTTHYGAGNIIQLTYRVNASISGVLYSGWWAKANYDSIDNYTHRRYGVGKIGTTAIAANTLVGYDNNGLVVNALTTPFDIKQSILWCGTAYAANATLSNPNFYEAHYSVSIAGTPFSGMTLYNPIYLKGTITDGLFTSVGLTQVKPVSEDGYLYMLVGVPQTTTNTIQFYFNNQIYHYVNNSFVQYSSYASSATKLANIRTIWGQNFDGGTNVTGNLGGSWFAINDVSSNPYVKLVEGANNWYLQGYANKLYLGNGTANSMVIDNLGNVGIAGILNVTNTTTNSAVFGGSVQGAINIQKNGTLGVGLYSPSAGQLGIYDNTAGLNRLYLHSSGNITINSTTDAGYKFDVNGTARVTGAITGDRINTVSESHMSVGTYADPASGIGAGLKVNGNFAAGGNSYFTGGNVMINTLTDSGYKLDINGTSRIFGGLHLNSEGWLNLYNGANTSRISISHNADVAKLDIYNRSTSAWATIQCGNIEAQTISIYNDQVERFIRSNVFGGAIRLRGNSSAATDRGIRFGRVDNSLNWLSQMAINADTGNVMINTTTDGGYKLDVNGNTRITGNLLATGEVTAYSASDMRLKTDIKQLTSGLDIINKLNPVKYKWNNLAKTLNPLKTDGDDYGLIAQELECVLPNLVHSVYNTYKSIDYVKLVPFLIKAVQEQQLEIENLKKQINKLSN